MREHDVAVLALQDSVEAALRLYFATNRKKTYTDSNLQGANEPPISVS